MKTKIKICLTIVCLFMSIIFTNCATKRQNDFTQYNLSLKNTLTIFLFNNENGYFFCIFLQYVGEFPVSDFEFDNGNIQIGNYNIPLNRDNVDVLVYFSEFTYENGLTMNQYSIFIERHLTDNEMSNIINQYRKGNVYSYFYIWFDITIDNIKQPGSGLFDDFKLYNGPLNEYIFSFFPHFELFIAKYLQR